MISGAEGGRIERALQSVADRAGEVIVVLNEDVRDGTDGLCEARGAKVYREPWKGFVAQKNSAAAKASCPWILSLDADEEVPPALWAEIAAMLEDSDKNRPYAAFDFPRCSYYCGRWIRHGDWYPDRVLRLWRKGSAAWTGIEIHERLEVKGAIGHLRSDLLHYSNTSINGQLDKIGRYADPFVRHCLETGRPCWVAGPDHPPCVEVPPRLCFPAGLPGRLARLLHRLAGSVLHGDPLRQGARGPPQVRPMSPAPSLALVVNTFNQPDYLLRLLNALWPANATAARSRAGRRRLGRPDPRRL